MTSPVSAGGSARRERETGSDFDGLEQQNQFASYPRPESTVSSESRGHGASQYFPRDAQYSSTVLHHQLSSSSSSSGVPELSPPSTATFSPTSSSSYSDFVSARSISSQPTPPLSGNPTHLLPPAEIMDDGKEKSWFGEMQESFLQQQASQGLSPPTPTHYIPSPSAARHRSPAPSYSPCPSPAASPYARSATPNYSSPPQSYSTVRRSSISSNPESPRRPPFDESRGRRQSRLSIAVPPYTVPSSVNGSRSAGYAPSSSLNSAGNIPISPNEVPLLPASSEEMDRLMQEIGTMLGPDVMASLESPSHQAPHTPQRRPQLLHTQSYDSGTIEMAGVTLSREDMDLLEEPELFVDRRPYPASAPAWKTTFDLSYPMPPPPSPQHQQQMYTQAGPYSPAHTNYNTEYYPPSPSYSYGHQQPASPGFLAPSNVPLRPRSAPGKGPHPQMYQACHSPAPTHRRRGSSVDSPAAMAASYGQYPPVTVMVSPSRSYHQPRTPPRQHNLNYEQDASPTSFPTSYQYPPQSPSKAAPRTPRTPRRRTQSTPAKKNVKVSPGISFINYTATDATVLLSGVAPSGSSKRKREEMEEAAGRKIEQLA